MKVTLNAEDPERTVTDPRHHRLTIERRLLPCPPGRWRQRRLLRQTSPSTERDLHLHRHSDSDNDDGESVKLAFGNTLPTGVSAGNTDEAVVTITDDDVPSVEVSFEQGSYTVDEGEHGGR